MPPRPRSNRPFAETARRKTCWIACRHARNFTSISSTTRTKPSWTSYSQKARKDNPYQEWWMSEDQLQAGAFKAKKSVALSGVTAGNTALCTVGKTGNDLHYRGYDILDIATQCEFEEIAHLLVHEKLPNRAQLAAYKSKLRALRGLPPPVVTVLEQLPKTSHPMDVLRTGASALGCIEAEGESHPVEGARDIADR